MRVTVVQKASDTVYETYLISNTIVSIYELDVIDVYQEENAWKLIDVNTILVQDCTPTTAQW